MSAGLSALLSPVSSEAFFANHWPREIAVVHGAEADRSGLLEIPELQSLDALLRCWKQPVSVVLPSHRDECSKVVVDPTSARKLYENGMSLTFALVEREIPALEPWLAALRVDLGLPESTRARCLVYVTQADNGTAAHFDQNANFVVQLRGHKRWHLAANEHVADPQHRFTIGTEPCPELSDYCAKTLPLEMPRDRTVVDMRPGSVLFVPRGVWHSTQAREESMSLNFTFSQPSWGDVVIEGLRRHVLRDPAWRRLADGVGAQATESRRAAAVAALSSRLSQLPGIASRLAVEDLLEDLP